MPELRAPNGNNANHDDDSPWILTRANLRSFTLAKVGDAKLVICICICFSANLHALCCDLSIHGWLLSLNFDRRCVVTYLSMVDYCHCISTGDVL